MKQSPFTEEQIVAILREADKTPVTEVAKKHKVSEQAIYTWRKRFGTIEPADVKRLRQLETENAIKKLLAERDLEIDVIRTSIAESGELAGAPRHLRSDNGSEFVSRAIFEWLANEKIDTALNDPGKPWQNGAAESFNQGAVLK